MPSEQTYAPKIKKAKLDDLDAGIENTSLRQIQELKLALDKNYHKRVYDLTKDIVTKTDLDQSLSIRIIKYAIEVRKTKAGWLFRHRSHSVQDLPKAVQVLLHHQTVDLNQEGENILREAVTAGDTAIAKLLIRAHANVNARYPGDNHTLLQEVIRSQRILKKREFIQLMLDYGADVHAHDSCGHSALYYAISHNSSQLVELLYSQQTFNLKTLEGGEMLWAAVEAGHEEIATMLVLAGADVRTCKPKDKGTILQAVLRNYKIKDNAKWEKLFILLLNGGADIISCDAEGRTVLIDAIVSEHCSPLLVKKLLTHGAVGGKFYLDDIDSIARSKRELLPNLIEHQVPDEETRNKRGVMVLQHLILEKGAVHTIKRILDLGVPVETPENQYGNQRCSLLHLALSHRQYDVIKLLLEHGANPHQKDEFGRTPLYQAAAFDYSCTSKRLIQAGARISDRNDDGRYPIHGACENQSFKNIQLLLNLGADINVTDNLGDTPFDSMDKFYRYNSCTHLVIKHLALTIAKGGKISDSDMAGIDLCVCCRNDYQACIEELRQMKLIHVCRSVPYFSLLSEDIHTTMQLMKNPALIVNFERSRISLFNLFPLYYNILLPSFKIAKTRYRLLSKKPVLIQGVFEAFEGILPDLVTEKIAHYSIVAAENQCQDDYYTSLLQTL